MSLNTILATTPLTTTGFHLKATGTTIGNSLIWDNGTNVGIGNTNTSYTLDVSGTFRTTGQYKNNFAGQSISIDTGTTASARMQLQNSGANAGITVESSTGGDQFSGTSAYSMAIGTYTEKNFHIGTNSVTRMTITSAGNVGIGTTSPLGSLNVQGTNIAQEGSATNSAGITLGVQSNQPRISLDNGAGAANVAGNQWCIDNSGGSLRFFTGGAVRATITSAGNVGIGTSSPLTILHLNSASGTNSTLLFGVNGTWNGYLGQAASAGSLANGAAIGDIVLRSQTNLLFTSGGDTERMRITSAGIVMINRTATGGQAARLQISTSATDGIYVEQVASGGYCVIDAAVSNGGTYYFNAFKAGATFVGDITSNGSTTTYATSSDYRMKEDFKDSKGLEKVSAIKIYDFKYKDSENRMDGVVAHELQEIIPYAVVGEKDGERMQGVDYSLIVPTLVKAIQEMNTKIIELEKLVATK